MLTRLRTALARRRTGVAVLWAVAALLATAVLGHVPTDAADHRAGHDTSHAVPAAAGDEAGHRHADSDGHLGCSAGEALCVLGVVLGLLLTRRLILPSQPADWTPSRSPLPAVIGWACVPARARPPGLTLLVRLQV